METIVAILVPIIGIAFGLGVRSVKIVSEENQALVERLGKFHTKLNAGLNFVNPLIDRVVLEDTLSERVLDILPHQAITKDNVSLTVDAVVYWRVIELQLAYYKVENIEEALINLVVTTMRSQIGVMELETTFSSREDINKQLLKKLDDETERWGVKVMRVEVKDIKPAPMVLEALEMEKAAESRKRAAILEAEGTVEAMKKLADALRTHPSSREVLQYLVAQRYVDASERLSESPNTKIVYMSPEPMGKTFGELLQNGGMDGGQTPPPPAPPNINSPNQPNPNGSSS
ncbi:paraslipin [Ancylothrix sp. C2]|uniref:SPFH domain-containing protein n=1 Tax=Ancylothrix sp. D3o TaxID=2953691 RepID=UPI0021BB9F17|nr:stomatin-like protein [Ancylothrix sp. D3o]MCT7952274.1 paraslipin [Ancylothrix sp. D3o]